MRLQDQPLGQEQVIGGFELGGKVALAAYVAGGFEIEEIRRQPLNAEGRPIAGGARIEIAAQSPLKVEVGGYGAVVEELLLAVVDRVAAERALRLDP